MTGAPVIAVVAIVITISGVGPRVRVPISKVRLRISVRVVLVRVVWLLIDHVRPLIVVDHHAAAMWPDYNPSSLAHRRDRQHHGQNERAHSRIKEFCFHNTLPSL